MKEKVKELGVKEMKRGILLGITDANTGDYVVVDEHNTPDKMAEYVAASCSIPALFEDIKMDDTVYIDGGVLINLNAASAIQKCKDMGYEEKDIVMDLIFAHESILYIYIYILYRTHRARAPRGGYDTENPSEICNI